MTQQIFEDMIGTAPPSTVDVEAVIRRQRRVIRWHRTAAAGTAGLLTVGLAVGLVTYASSTPSPVPRLTGPPQPAATGPRATLWPPEAVARMEQEMRDVVPQVAPGAKVSDVRREGPFGTYDSPIVRTWPPANPRDVRGDGIPDGEEYGTSATVRLGDRKGALRILVKRRLDGSGVPADRCVGFEGHCVETTSPEGRFMMINTDEVPAETGSTPEISYMVDVYRGDGVWVRVYHLNGIHADLPNSDAPPLTLDQVKQIALDPDLIPDP